MPEERIPVERILYWDREGDTLVGPLYGNLSMPRVTAIMIDDGPIPHEHKYNIRFIPSEWGTCDVSAHPKTPHPKLLDCDGWMHWNRPTRVCSCGEEK